MKSQMRPIIFSDAMVRAILDGKKTQTRRLVKLPTGFERIDRVYQIGDSWRIDESNPHGISRQVTCPYGEQGDRLWVRERWRPLSRHATPSMEHPPVVDVGGAVPTYQVQRGVAYCADGAIAWADGCEKIYDATGRPPRGAKSHLAEANGPIRWKPSIHMPRRASRIDLELTDVRAQYLNDISEADARAEGCDAGKNMREGSCRDLFSVLWDGINSERAPWASNPWVWALTFKKVTP